VHVIAVVVLLHEDRVLLCHRTAQRAWYPDCWDFAGGHVEEGESPAAAAVRECREELGVTVRDLVRVDCPLADPDVEVHAFTSRTWEGEITNRAPEEHDALRWFTAQELPGLVLADPAYVSWLTALLG
jgi:8-oxo-dGTP pyrophosphatase MutT (NUDIX family)